MIDNLRIAHLNVQAFNDPVKQNSLLKRVGYEYDILHLAETHSSPKTEAVVKKSYPHLEFYFNHGPQFKERSDGRRHDKEQAKGTVIVFPSNLGKASAFKILISGQLSCLDLKIGSKDFRITSVYAPAEAETNARLDFFKQIFTPDTLDPDKLNIIPGDWNCGLTELDHHMYEDWKTHRPRTRKFIQTGVLEHFLCEPYRLIHETKKITQTEGWSWYNDKDPRNKSKDPKEKEKVKRSRIDYILVSEALMDFINQARITNPPFQEGTDHRIVSINIQFNSFIRGIGYYRNPPGTIRNLSGTIRNPLGTIRNPSGTIRNPSGGWDQKDTNRNPSGTSRIP